MENIHLKIHLKSANQGEINFIMNVLHLKQKKARTDYPNVINHKNDNIVIYCFLDREN